MIIEQFGGQYLEYMKKTGRFPQDAGQGRHEMSVGAFTDKQRPPSIQDIQASVGSKALCGRI